MVYLQCCACLGHVRPDNRRESVGRGLRAPGRLPGAVLARDTPASVDDPLDQYSRLATVARASQHAAEAPVFERRATVAGLTAAAPPAGNCLVRLHWQSRQLPTGRAGFGRFSRPGPGLGVFRLFGGTWPKM